MSEVVLPQLGESVTEGTITRWFKSVGDNVEEDEPLFEVSTDKVDTEVPSPVSGVLQEIKVAEGDTVDVGTVLALVGEGDAAPTDTPATDTAQAAPAEPTPEPAPAAEAPPPQPAAREQPAAQAQPAAQPPPEPAREEPAASEPAPQPETVDERSSASTGRLLSPLVRRLIDEHGMDPDAITGTGVGGRITREDVLDAVDAAAARDRAAPSAQAQPAAPQAPAQQQAPAPAQQPAQPAAPRPPAATAPAPSRQTSPQVAPMRPGAGDVVEPLNRIRRMTGDLMSQSKATSPHVITMVEADYSAVEAARLPRREQFKAEHGYSLTYLPFITRAVVDALAEYPHMNASMGEGEVILHNEVNMSIAVDLDFEGLLAPVIRDAHDKRLHAIADDISDLAHRARNKQLGPDELTGGTFTLSNSGAFGSAMVAPIINQPQVAILSTDGVFRKPVVVTDDSGGEAIAIHPMGNLTLVWDHRAFDGAYAASFLSRTREIIETRDWSTEF